MLRESAKLLVSNAGVIISTLWPVCVLNSIIPFSHTSGRPWQVSATLCSFRVMLDCQSKTRQVLLALAIGQTAAGIIQHSHAIICVKQWWHRPWLSCFRAMCDLKIVGEPFPILRLVWLSQGRFTLRMNKSLNAGQSPVWVSLIPHWGLSQRCQGKVELCHLFSHISGLLGYKGSQKL